MCILATITQTSEKSVSECEYGEGSDEDAERETDEEWEIAGEDELHNDTLGACEEDVDGEDGGEGGQEELDDNGDGIGTAVRTGLENDEEAKGEDEEVDDDDDSLGAAMISGFNNVEECPPSFVQEHLCRQW